MSRPATSLSLLLLFAACGTDPQHATDIKALGLSHHAEPMPGVHTSGQPTEAQFARLPDLGVRRVITLRPADEKGTGWEEAAAKKDGIELVRLPIHGTADFDRAHVQQFADELAKGGGQPTLVSCGSSNRVGAMFALKAAWLDGKSPEEAVEIGKKAGLAKFTPDVRKALGLPEK